VAYTAMTELSFTVGPSPYGRSNIIAPGGTILHRTPQGAYDGYTHYPQGAQWTIYVSDGYLNMDVYAKLRGLDAGKSYDAMGWGRAAPGSVDEAPKSRWQHLWSGRLAYQMPGPQYGDLRKHGRNLDDLVADATQHGLASQRHLVEVPESNPQLEGPEQLWLTRF
jgi:hypothetical protein